MRQDGLGDIIFTNGLKPGRDDASMKSSLYMCPTGETETMDQVAARLSNHDKVEVWNPYPTKNSEFDWWSAINRAKIKDLSHLDDLLSLFPPPDYREIDLLAWRSEKLLEIGDRYKCHIAGKASY